MPRDERERSGWSSIFLQYIPFTPLHLKPSLHTGAPDTTVTTLYSVSTSTGVSSHASVHVGVIAPEYNQAGKRVQRHARASTVPALGAWACTGPSQDRGAQVGTRDRARCCTQGMAVCALRCLPVRACATPAAYI